MGVGDCHELTPNVTSLCGKQGCWPQVKVEGTFDLLDGNSTAIIGPTISLVPHCGCRPPTKDYGIYNTPKIPTVHPAAHALMKDEKHVCKEDACLNGGKCIPTVDGYR